MSLLNSLTLTGQRMVPQFFLNFLSDLPRVTLFISELWRAGGAYKLDF